MGTPKVGAGTGHGFGSAQGPLVHNGEGTGLGKFEGQVPAAVQQASNIWIAYACRGGSHKVAKIYGWSWTRLGDTNLHRSARLG